MKTPAVRLHLQPQSTLLELVDGRTVTLAVGPRGLAESALRHDPPTPGELERAIDLVEDALAGWRQLGSGSDRLVTAHPPLLTLPGLEAPDAGLDLDGVEALFQRLASRALGTPIAAAQLPHGRDVAAALIILRECMHHLGFGHVGAAEAPGERRDTVR